jgi:alpha-glucosidase
VIETGNYVRFERVDCVVEIEDGLLAELHGERLRLDLLRDDVLRVKISRGGLFDESPTFAVCVDPLAEDVQFSVERADGVVRLHTPALVASLWLGLAGQ